MPQSPRSFGERRQRVGAAKVPVVNPLWPLFAFMFAGVWIAWPWFLLNEALMKSDDLARQCKVVLVGLLGSLVLSVVLLYLLGIEALDLRQAKYAMIGLLAWKLGIAYTLQARQDKTFSLWQYFGGTPRNGAYVAIFGFLVTAPLFDALPFGVLWLVLR
jgi:hypothetical protein